MGNNSQSLLVYPQIKQQLTRVICGHNHTMTHVKEETPKCLIVQFAQGAAVRINVKIGREDYLTPPQSSQQDGQFAAPFSIPVAVDDISVDGEECMDERPGERPPLAHSSRAAPYTNTIDNLFGRLVTIHLE